MIPEFSIGAIYFLRRPEFCITEVYQVDCNGARKIATIKGIVEQEEDKKE